MNAIEIKNNFEEAKYQYNTKMHEIIKYNEKIIKRESNLMNFNLIDNNIFYLTKRDNDTYYYNLDNQCIIIYSDSIKDIDKSIIPYTKITDTYLIDKINLYFYRDKYQTNDIFESEDKEKVKTKKIFDIVDTYDKELLEDLLKKHAESMFLIVNHEDENGTSIISSVSYFYLYYRLKQLTK